MKKLFVCILALLFALTACAVAEEAPALTETAAQGDGYTIAYDATAFAFYRDGVIEGTDLLVPTQDAVSPVYLLVSRVEDVQAEVDSFTGENYTDAGGIVLASGLHARTFTLEREAVGYTAYIVENGDDAWCILCVCAQQEEAYAQRLLDVANTFAPAPEATPAATAVQE